MERVIRGKYYSLKSNTKFNDFEFLILIYDGIYSIVILCASNPDHRNF